MLLSVPKYDFGWQTTYVLEQPKVSPYRDAMRVSSNSWGASVNTYTTDAQRYDALVRDAQPDGSAQPAPGNQEMVIVFAAGNAGPYGGSIGSPGSAKNVISAGASEGAQPFAGPDACGIGDSDASSALDVAFFSSRGPAADGRRRPDVMAPGTHISGGVAQAAGQRASPPPFPLGQALSCFNASGVCAGYGSNFFPSGQQWYTASSGTSHSTPAIAGAAALVRQWFLNQSLAAAYYLKEDLRQFWEQPGKKFATLFLDGWIKRAEAPGIKMLQQMAKTLAAHRSGLLARAASPALR